MFSTKFRAVIYSFIILKFAWLSITQTACSAKHWSMHFERARGLGDLKRGIRGRLRNSSPLVSLLINLYLKVNFKISFTRKNWLLKFGFAYSLAQILERNTRLKIWLLYLKFKPKNEKFSPNLLRAKSTYLFLSLAQAFEARRSYR